LVQLAKLVLITSIKIKHSVQFSGGGVTKANIYLHDGNTYQNTDLTEGMFCKYDVFKPVGEFTGKSFSVQQRQTKISGVKTDIICNETLVTNLWLILEVDNAHVCSDLTQGEFYIWIDYTRLK